MTDYQTFKSFILRRSSSMPDIIRLMIDEQLSISDNFKARSDELKCSDAKSRHLNQAISKLEIAHTIIKLYEKIKEENAD